ncbi:hypothetical protein RFI_12632, partial [Reticulomyxa filosa]
IILLSFFNLCVLFLFGLYSSNVPSVPFRKFLPLICQISSRLSLNPSSSSSATATTSVSRQKPREDTSASPSWATTTTATTQEFHDTIYHLVKQMAIEHPYHVLYQLFLLSNADQIDDLAMLKSGFQTNERRKYAANCLLKELKQDENLRAIIENLDKLIKGYRDIALAGHCESNKTSKTEKCKTFDIDKFALSRIVNSNVLPVVSVDYPVLPGKQYRDREVFNVPFIQGWNPKAEFSASGITKPVIVECLGSDGSVHRQLVKPQDDLRQDAVMQQVFGLVNTLLAQSLSIREGRVQIRTYKCVPLTPTIGLVEWVRDTIPMGIYLHKAHLKYQRNRDLTPAQKKDTTIRQVFDEICNKFPPVLHHFFIERFACPVAWFQARLNYVRSVATNSMVGYLLGLGDRHPHNILLDQKSAELIHVDLGVAFDLGRLLKTPEMVPFRLTRDIVDGMGVQGTQGTFQRCCIEVMKNLKENREMIYTVLEVFIHDPLYRWSLSYQKIKKLQRDEITDRLAMEYQKENEAEIKNQEDATKGNEKALRALQRIREKFQGIEYGHIYSVEAQVNWLIAEATERGNLCRMYHGWCAWM